jgi:MFS family permease
VRLLLLGLATVFAMVDEGAVADWSSVLLRDHLEASAGQAGLAYTAFAITMTAGRLVGDRVVHRFGRRLCVAVLSVVGAVGLAAGLGIDRLPAVVAGFALLGVGLSIMVPVMFSSAADGDGPPGPAIALVATIGYTGFLVGPTLIGLLAEAIGLYPAMAVLPLGTLAAGALGLVVIRPRAAAPDGAARP